jgi:hypothetical protein
MGEEVVVVVQDYFLKHFVDLVLIEFVSLCENTVFSEYAT